MTNVQPTATFVAPATVDAGNPFTLSLTNPFDPAPADVQPTSVRVRLRLGLRAFGTAPTATCPTSNVGPLSVGAMIRDKDGGLTEYRATVQRS